MSIDKIRDAEDKAEKIIVGAKEKAQEMVMKARREALAMTQNAQSAVHSEIEKAKKASAKVINKEKKAVNTDKAKTLEEIESIDKKKVNKAVQTIVDAVTKVE
jgi:vacuolar-type H+-ATPase subunit H